MKKKICTLLALLLIFAGCCGIPAFAEGSVPADETATAEETAPTEETATAEEASAAEDTTQQNYVVDDAGILTEEQRDKLQKQAAELSESQSCGLYIVTVKDHTPFHPDAYEAAKAIYRRFDLGIGVEKNGVILLLSMNERDYAFTGHGNLGETICGYESSWIVEDAFLDNFRRNDWYGGFSDYLTACDSQLTRLKNGEDITQGADIITGSDGLEYHSYNAPTEGPGMPTGLKILIVIGVPCLIALIVCSSFKAQMKSATERTSAEEYVVPGSAILRTREDRFTHRTETRTRISSDSSSGGSRGGGGGGSSFHSGGGFSGRSGKF